MVIFHGYVKLPEGIFVWIYGTDSATKMENRRSKFWVPFHHICCSELIGLVYLGLSSSRLPGRFEKLYPSIPPLLIQDISWSHPTSLAENSQFIWDWCYPFAQMSLGFCGNQLAHEKGRSETQTPNVVRSASNFQHILSVDFSIKSEKHLQISSISLEPLYDY